MPQMQNRSPIWLARTHPRLGERSKTLPLKSWRKALSLLQCSATLTQSRLISWTLTLVLSELELCYPKFKKKVKVLLLIIAKPFPPWRQLLHHPMGAVKHFWHYFYGQLFTLRLTISPWGGCAREKSHLQKLPVAWRFWQNSCTS